MVKLMKGLSFILALIFMISGCSSSSSISSTTPGEEEPDVSFYGKAMDGYFKNMFIFADINEDGVYTEGIDVYTYSNNNGNFLLKGKKSKGFKKGVVIIGLGGSDVIDISTGKAFTGMLKTLMDEPKENPAEAAVVVMNPLTTLTVEIGDQEVVKTNLGIQGNYDIFTYDAIAATQIQGASQKEVELALKVQASIVKVVNIVQTITSTIIGAEIKIDSDSKDKDSKDSDSKDSDSKDSDSKDKDSKDKDSKDDDSSKSKKNKHNIFSIALSKLSVEIAKPDFKVEHLETTTTVTNIVNNVSTEVSSQQIINIDVEKIEVVKTKVVNMVVAVNQQTNEIVNNISSSSTNDILTNISAVTVVVNNSSTNIQNATATGSQTDLDFITNITNNVSNEINVVIETNIINIDTFIPIAPDTDTTIIIIDVSGTGSSGGTDI